MLFDIAIINSNLNMVSNYLNKDLLKETLTLIPNQKIWLGALKKLRKTQMSSQQVLDESVLLENYFLEELISWFKNDFFTWFDTPICSKCGCLNCKRIFNVLNPKKTFVVNTEVFECEKCQSRYYFDRYHNPYILLKTRKGRCSEFSQVFTVICIALKYEARFIHDINDHAWTEVYSCIQNRWIHCDPSEGIIDNPLMYELDWGKKPTVILSFSPTREIQDVTWRYSSDHKGILRRREQITNVSLFSIVSKHNEYIFSQCPPFKKRFLFGRIISELAEFMIEPKAKEDNSSGVLKVLEVTNQRSNVESKNTGFTFKLIPNQQQEKINYFSMWYSSNIDSYIYYHEKGKSFVQKDWRSCINSFFNIVRNEETDWKQSYLSRERNGEPGKIRWKFDLNQTNYKITGVFMKTNAFFVDSGTVEVRITNDKNQIIFTKGNQSLYAPLYSDNTLTIEVTLNGGRGEIAWQQAQIGRQSNLEGSAVSFGVVLFLSSNE